MTKKGLFGVSVVSVVALMGSFVCSPVFADGPVNISIVEVADDGNENLNLWEDITGAMPGETYSAIPRVKNDGELPVSVRMCLSESATDAGGGTINLIPNTFGIEINEHWVLDAEASMDAGDPAVGNCYNYDSEVAVGAVTEPIFTEVTLSSALGNEYKNATFNLHLVADAIGDKQDEPDEPVKPDVTPSNPDTGANTNSEPLTTVWYVSLSVGLVVLAGMIAYLITKSLRKK